MARSPKDRTRAKRPKRGAPRKSSKRKSASRRARAGKRPASKAPQRKVAARRKARKTARTPARSARKTAMRPRASKRGLRIALFGAGGMVGSRVAKEALDRGHDVVAVQRNPGGLDLGGRHLMTIPGDATDAGSVATIARGCDAIVSAVSPRDPPGADTLARAARALLAGARKSGVRRLVVAGGAGSLIVAPGTMLIDTPQFPDEFKPEAREHIAALNIYRNEGQGVDWTFVSPAALVEPGKRTGKYQSGRDNFMVGRDGQSHISAEDFAVAIVDELESGANKGRRIAVAWP